MKYRTYDINKIVSTDCPFKEEWLFIKDKERYNEVNGKRQIVSLRKKVVQDNSKIL